MKVNEKAKKVLLSSTVTKAVNLSVRSANTSCVIWQYQTKTSDAVKKLRKF